MCESCKNVYSAPTFPHRRAEALLNTFCTCAGPAGPAYCDLHSQRMLLDRLVADRLEADEHAEPDAAVEEVWEKKAEKLEEEIGKVFVALREQKQAFACLEGASAPKGKKVSKASAAAAAAAKAAAEAAVDAAIDRAEKAIGALLEAFLEEDL